MAVGGVTAVMFLVVLAGCGGSEASPSAAPSEEASSTPTVTTAPASEAPSVEPEVTDSPPAVVRLVAQCAGVGIRKGPGPEDELLVRVAKGAKVRVVETVTGEPYEAGTCGQSGDDWIKIDRINGKSVKSLYDVPFGYAAGGFFK
jgi:hypothetical protein